MQKERRMMQPEDRMGRRLLFTPGPLTTTRTVREAMLSDIGSWDSDSIQLTREGRRLAKEYRRLQGHAA